ncbi:uncharacterized protein V2V93DRAFT_377543 [Kockiozyma suomiensis]|uniref:uncharacterized protein n=1 Tax=Kockiozyma suomiensis TaxID=1337062 RepID=UPI003343FB67
MADDFNYEIDIYDDENDTRAPQQSRPAGSGNDSDVEIAGSFADDANSQRQRHPDGKWHATVPYSQPDNRPVDSNATPALSISDLDWWTSEEDVRGWAALANVEYELKDVTFNEHKANGKSRGAVFMEFISPQAATAVRNYLSSAPDLQRFTAVYQNPNNNPFRMVPKDPGPRRDMNGMNQSGGMNNMRGGPMGMRGRGGYGGRGGFNNRGGGNMGGPGGGMPGMYNPNMNMGGFNGMPMNMFGFHGGPGRGGPMNMRGGMGGGRGRGGMDGGFNPMMGGGGFGGFPPQGFPQPHFNPAFFNGQDGGQGGWQNDGNPHGNKRQRGPD